MILDMLLGGGVALTSATQLRLGGLPFGPGELLLVLWICLSGVRLAIFGPAPQMAALARMALFWGVFATSLSIGAFVGILVHARIGVSPTLHDTLAYLLVATITIVALLQTEARRRLERAAWFLITFSTVGLLLQIADAYGFFPIPRVEPWYWDRFRGWSENPNQLAILCCITSLLALHLATTTGGPRRALALAAVAVSIVGGRLSKSDTFVTVMILVGLLLVALRLRAWLSLPQHRQGLRHGFALLITISALPLAVSLAPFVLADAVQIESFALSLTKDRGGDATEHTIALRLLLWDEAAETGLRSGSLGFGPGPHLDPPADLFSLDRPFEAHSTPLDTYLQGGALALFALAALLGNTFVLLYRAKRDVLLALLLAMSIFSAAHFVLRHPLVWFVLAYSVSVGCAARPRAVAIAR
ncbi:MAG TPA: polymerase [Xanthobacteraceae bacterium]|nr:polymerase [Xanthobacteraceae bacterium]